MEKQKVERFLEFLVIGVLMGTIEDVIAVKLATGETIDPRMLFIIVGVAIPFAAFSELIVDNPDTKLLDLPSKIIHKTMAGDSSEPK